jgi:hypothetical protein
VPEKGGLGEDFDVEELGPRLQRYGRQFFEPMEAARRMHVDHRHSKDEPPARRAQPARDPRPDGDVPPAQDVVAMIDCLKKRVQVIGGPRFSRRGDQHEPLRGSFKPGLNAVRQQIIGTVADDLGGGRTLPFRK